MVQKENGYRRLALLLVLGAILLLMLPILLSTGEDRVEQVFHRQQAAFARTAEAALAGESWQVPGGVQAVSVWPCVDRPGAELVEFTLGGWGLGSQTDYWAVYTTTDGLPAGFQGTEMALTETAPGQFSWQEAAGDNRYRTWSLAPGWFGCRMHF